MEISAKEYNAAFREARLGEKKRYSWEEAVLLWLNEKPARREKKQYDLIWLDQYLRNKMLDEINRDLILFIKKSKLDSGVKARTVNAVLQQIRGILKCAFDHDMIDKVISIKLLPEEAPRQVSLSYSQEENLITELPDHLVPIALFALATGLRMSNITGLLWSNVDIKRRHAWVNIGDGKVKSKGIGVPLNSVAMHVIKNLIGKHPTHVFTYKCNPIKRANSRAWRKARKRAGLPHLHFHDLRHIWASRHAMKGTSMFALQDLGAWTKADTVRRYAHLSSDHLLEQSENSVKSDTKLAHSVSEITSIQ